MGTREVYEKKLKSGNLHFDPTMNPGLGTARCPRCYTIIDPNARSGSWTITPELHDIAKVAGFGIGGLFSAVFGVNTGIPFIQKHVNGPKWMQLMVKRMWSQSLVSSPSRLIMLRTALLIMSFRKLLVE